MDAVARELDQDGFLLRYRPDADGGVDGLPGTEGAFLACTFWLADALAGLRRTDEAERLFERLLGLRNDLGLLSEEYDVRAQRQVGNTPQAFSHVGPGQHRPPPQRQSAAPANREKENTR